MTETSEEFKEARFIIERWKTLIDTSRQLNEVIEKSSELLEIQRSGIQKYRDKMENLALGYNNEITILQKEVENMVDRGIRGEADFHEKAETLVGKALEESQIKM